MDVNYGIEELELYNQKLHLKTFNDIENLDLIDELENILKTNQLFQLIFFFTH